MVGTLTAGAQIAADLRADRSSWSAAHAARERMICVTHGLVGIDRQTPDSADDSAFLARMLMR